MMSLLFHVNMVIRLSKQLVIISISGLLGELEEMQWNSYRICKTTPCHFDLHLCLCQFTFVCLQMWSACDMCGFKYKYTMYVFFIKCAQRPSCLRSMVLHHKVYGFAWFDSMKAKKLTVNMRKDSFVLWFTVFPSSFTFGYLSFK